MPATTAGKRPNMQDRRRPRSDLSFEVLNEVNDLNLDHSHPR